MSRRRFVQLNGELVEIGQCYNPTPRSDPRSGDAVLWNDRAYQDMNDPRFASRKQHREYMKRNNLSTIDDYKGEWARAAEKRAQYLTKGVDTDRRADIIRALERKRA